MLSKYIHKLFEQSCHTEWGVDENSAERIGLWNCTSSINLSERPYNGPHGPLMLHSLKNDRFNILNLLQSTEILWFHKTRNSLLSLI